MITYDKETQAAIDLAQNTLKEFDLKVSEDLRRAIEGGAMDIEQAVYQFNNNKERMAILESITYIYATATSFTMTLPTGSE